MFLNIKISKFISINILEKRMETSIMINKSAAEKHINISIEKIYILSVLLLPILSLYSIGISTYSLGDLFLTISLLLLLFKKAKTILNTKINIWLFVLLIYIFIISIIITIINDDFNIMPTMRYIFYLANILFFVQLDFYKKFVINAYLTISIFVSIFVIVQFISFEFFSYPIPFFKFIDSQLSGLVYIRDRKYFSFFSEPAAYGEYILPSILVCLFSENKNKLLTGIFLTFTVFLSKTFTGILGCLFVWGAWALHFIFERKIAFSRVFLWLLTGLCIAFIIILSFDLKDFLFDKSEFLHT